MLSFAGKTGAGRILVGSTEVILRGEVRLRLARGDVLAVRVERDDLILETPRGPVVATLGARVADAMRATLLRPAPSLREKLGVTPAARAGCLWPVTDRVLAAAIKGHGAPVAEAAVLVAELLSVDALDRLVALLPDLAGRPVWCVNAKGRGAACSEARVREALRTAGWIDTKTTAVSDAVSATRYGQRKS